MIKSIRHRGLATLYQTGSKKGVHASQVKRLLQILALLETVIAAEDMNLPGLRFHALKGDLKGFYSVSVSGNWRIIFRFDEGAEDVDLVDYH